MCGIKYLSIIQLLVPQLSMKNISYMSIKTWYVYTVYLAWNQLLEDIFDF